MCGVQLRTEPEDVIKHLLFCIILDVCAKEEASVGNIYEQEQKITEVNETRKYGMCSASHVFCMYVTEMHYKLLISLRYM